MRPWYRYSEKTDDFRRPVVITPFSRIWGYGAPVTIALVIINAVIWLVMIYTKGPAPELPWLVDWWYGLWAMTPEDVLKHGRVYQLITSVFLHDAQNILHLAFNMYLLWVFGPRVERTFSSKRFLAFYLACGLGGSVLSLAARSLMGDMYTPSLGASAAVFGVVVAYGFLFANEKLLLFFAIPLTVWKAVVGFIVIETLLILFHWLEDVDHWAHLGGAAAAAIWMLILIRQEGHKTAHGWQHTSRPTWFPGGDMPGMSGRKRPGGFRIIIRKPPPVHDDHPEGTDDEERPQWFDI